MNVQKKSVMGVVALAPYPEWRGFLQLALLLSGPVAIVLFSVEFLYRSW